VRWWLLSGRFANHQRTIRAVDAAGADDADDGVDVR
jgi:hypothetical protein